MGVDEGKDGVERRRQMRKTDFGAGVGGKKQAHAWAREVATYVDGFVRVRLELLGVVQLNTCRRSVAAVLRPTTLVRHANALCMYRQHEGTHSTERRKRGCF